MGAHGPGHAEPPRLPAPRKFAPRPTYEHRAIFDRADDDLDDLEIRPAAPPVDRIFDFREEFVDQGSYRAYRHAQGTFICEPPKDVCKDTSDV